MSKGEKSRVFDLSFLVPYLLAISSILEVLSAFLPWSKASGADWFLPYSLPLPLGWTVEFINEGITQLFICIAIRFAAITAIIALILYVYRPKLKPSLILLVSIGLSISAYIAFSQLKWAFYIGPYMVLLAAIMKISALICKNIQIELTVENTSHS